MDKELKKYMSNVDEVVSLLKAKAARLEGELTAALARAKRAEKALKEIMEIHPSVSGAYDMIRIATDALAPKKSTDEKP